MKVNFLVVGAGPTGIGAAHNLQRRKENFLLIDSDARPGGLAKSVTDEHGFTWDMGVHVQYSHYELFDHFMDSALGREGWTQHVRQSWIWIAGRLVPYPLQNNIHRLPEAEREMCLEGLRHLAVRPEHSRNFRTWIDTTFGSGLAQVFMIPYNLKVWAHPLEMMSSQWVGERVAVPSLEAAIEAGKTMSDRVSWGPNSTFRFPAHGGTGTIWTALASRIANQSIHLGDCMIRVDPTAHIAYLASGREVGYDHMISTMPVDRLTRLLGTQTLAQRAAHLLRTTTHVVGIGLVGSPPPGLEDLTWVYFPESDCPFYRVTVFSNYSPSSVPSPDAWSLIAEVSESQYKPVDRDSVVTSVLDGMRATRLIPPTAQVVSRWHTVLDHGYPLPTVDRDQVLDDVLPALESLDIYSRGRFGGWKYEVSNQDHSFMQGWECIDRVCEDLGRDAEATLMTPNKVNAMKRPSTLRL